ncbi:hypothetical protein [Massilia aerilata]|uniref:Uncharacterized protein n=1 Tax=Massilia aerilata TaxID=453817 RepID=A0ABW0RZP3_9BURK
MSDPAARKAIVLELFAATGESIPENDPIVTGAIIFSHKLNEVAKLSAEEMRAAGRLAAAALHEAAKEASLVLDKASERRAVESAATTAKAEAAVRAAAGQIERMAADRAQLLKLVEASAKSAKATANGQPGPLSLRYVPAWFAVIGALVGAVALASAWVIGVERGTAQAEDAAVGRSFARAVLTMDPKLRQELMEHLSKNSG